MWVIWMYYNTKRGGVAQDVVVAEQASGLLQGVVWRALGGLICAVDIDGAV